MNQQTFISVVRSFSAMPVDQREEAIDLAKNLSDEKRETLCRELRTADADLSESLKNMSTFSSEIDALQRQANAFRRDGKEVDIRASELKTIDEKFQQI